MTRTRTRAQERLGIVPPPPGAMAPFLTSAKAAAAATPGAVVNAYPETARTLEVWHPWLYPFPGSTDFRKDEQFASAGAGDIQPAALQFQLPNLKRGIINQVGISLLNLAPTSVILWQVLVNGRPVEGWQNLTFFPGNVPRVTASLDAKIPVPNGGKIGILFRNTDGAAYTVGASYYGWYWDDEAERQWMGEAR